jgi:2-methylisocitrate lyase-like PEP mutase family enzyme
MSSSHSKSLIGAAKLRASLAENDKIIACPGVYDGLTARIALKVGFECLYMVGLSSMFR